MSLVVLGVAHLPRSRLTAYRWFERSILVSVFFTQVLMFWQAQLAALSGLALDLVLLAGLRYMLRQEEARRVVVGFGVAQGIRRRSSGGF